MSVGVAEAFDGFLMKKRFPTKKTSPVNTRRPKLAKNSFLAPMASYINPPKRLPIAVPVKRKRGGGKKSQV